METIYRYLRPIRFSTRGNMLETSPKGGVCLRVTRDGPATYIQYSVCPDDAYFSKSTAQHQAGLVAAIPCHPDGYAISDLIDWVPPDVALTMDKIIHQNGLANVQLHVYKSTVSALRLQERYHALQHADA